MLGDAALRDAEADVEDGSADDVVYVHDVAYEDDVPNIVLNLGDSSTAEDATADVGQADAFGDGG